MMKRAAFSFGVIAVILAIAFIGHADAQTSPTHPDPTIEAYQTQVVKLNAKVEHQATSIAKENAKISRQGTEIADLKAQIPPTALPTPMLEGKDAFAPIADIREIKARTGQHIGEKLTFCGTVTAIFTSTAGQKFSLGDTKPKGYDAELQIIPNGASSALDGFMVGFNGDTTGIFENSYVCVWGTLVDTLTYASVSGGGVTNPLFDATYLELG